MGLASQDNYETISLNMYYDGWLGMATTLPTYGMLQKTDFSLSFTFMTLTGWKPSSFTWKIESDDNTIMRQICGLMRMK